MGCANSGTAAARMCAPQSVRRPTLPAARHAGGAITLADKYPRGQGQPRKRAQARRIRVSPTDVRWRALRAQRVPPWLPATERDLTSRKMQSRRRSPRRSAHASVQVVPRRGRSVQRRQRAKWAEGSPPPGLGQRIARRLANVVRRRRNASAVGAADRLSALPLPAWARCPRAASDHPRAQSAPCALSGPALAAFPAGVRAARAAVCLPTRPPQAYEQAAAPLRSRTISSSCAAESGEKTLSLSFGPHCSRSRAVTRKRTRERPRIGEVSQRARWSAAKRALVRTETTRIVISAARTSRGRVPELPPPPPSRCSCARTALSLSSSSGITRTGCGCSRREPNFERKSLSQRGSRPCGSASAASSASSVSSHKDSSVMRR
eukprot:scaffold3696_cov27-Tisochrysis_lutea.AAC.2